MPSKRDPLQVLRKSVAEAQGNRTPRQVDNRSLVEHLLANVNWQRLLPILIPLVMQVLRNRQSAQSQPAQGLGAQALRPKPGQPDAASGAPMDLGGLLQALGGGQASAMGGLLGLLGANPAPQRATRAGSMLDHLASNVDLNGDGGPDALQSVLGTSIDTATQRNGAATLLEQLLSNASPKDLESFSRSAQQLLTSGQ